MTSSAPSVTVSGPTITVRDQVTGVTATAGNRSASVAWNATPDGGGCPSRGYLVTATDTTDPAAPVTVAADGLSTTVGGLTPGHVYRFTVVAVNLVGASAVSAPSGPGHTFSSPELLGTPGPATADAAYGFAYTVDGFPAPAVRVTSGSLPPGLTLSTGGTVSGTRPRPARSRSRRPPTADRRQRQRARSHRGLRP